MDGAELGAFLRSRRAAAAPTSPEPGTRKVPGLRREEVAESAGISLDYYTRLEQNRTSRPSAQVVAALAAALRLTEPQRGYLARLTDNPVPPPPAQDGPADGALLRILAYLDAVPAHVMTDLGETLAQNRLSLAVFGDAASLTGPRRSTYYRWFTDPASRRAFAPETWDAESRARVADLRATVARRTDRPARALVARLLARSAEFAGLWAAREVASRHGNRKRLLGPTGPLEVDSQFLRGGPSDQLLVVFTPVDGTDAGDRLARIAG